MVHVVEDELHRFKLLHTVAALRTETSVMKLHDIADHMDDLLDDELHEASTTEHRYIKLVHEALRLHDPDNYRSKREQLTLAEAKQTWKFAAGRVIKSNQEKSALPAAARILASVVKMSALKEVHPLARLASSEEATHKLHQLEHRGEERRATFQKELDLCATKWLMVTQVRCSTCRCSTCRCSTCRCSTCRCTCRPSIPIAAC